MTRPRLSEPTEEQIGVTPRADPNEAAASLTGRDRSRWLIQRVSRATEHGVVRQTERERRMVDQTGIEPVTS